AAIGVASSRQIIRSIAATPPMAEAKLPAHASRDHCGSNLRFPNNGGGRDVMALHIRSARSTFPGVYFPQKVDWDHPKPTTARVERGTHMKFSASAIAGLLLAMVLSAQTTSTSILGTVTDPSGAAVANATVSALNVKTGIETKTVSTASGDYTIPLLDVGEYD